MGGMRREGQKHPGVRVIQVNFKAEWNQILDMSLIPLFLTNLNVCEDLEYSLLVSLEIANDDSFTPFSIWTMNIEQAPPNVFIFLLL